MLMKKRKLTLLMLSPNHKGRHERGKIKKINKEMENMYNK